MRGACSRLFLVLVFISAALFPAGAADGKEAPASAPASGSKLDINLYGYIKLDAAFDDSRANPGAYIRWVESEALNNDDSQFTMTVNQTRLGLKIGAPEENGIKLDGRVEIDFYGGGEPNKARPFLRHAFMKIAWPDKHLEVIAGQTSDLISPLYVSSLNYIVAWWTGNIGYRRPQIRVTRTFATGNSGEFQLAGAATINIGSTTSALYAVGDSGQDEGAPGLQARLGWRLPGDRGTVLGVSGHWGQEQYDTDTAGNADTFKTWSLNLDFHHPFRKDLVLEAEAFRGINLAPYLGGIGQGVNLTRMTEIRSQGGWVALKIAPRGKRSYYVGASVDDVNDDDVEPGARTRNRSIFANMVCATTSHLDIGFELSHWLTAYKGEKDADDFRVQTSFIYKF